VTLPQGNTNLLGNFRSARCLSYGTASHPRGIRICNRQRCPWNRPNRVPAFIVCPQCGSLNNPRRPIL